MAIKTHSTDQCVGEFCVIHNPSDHHMKTWPKVFRLDHWPACLTERICEHGIGHPDPDSLAYLATVHAKIDATIGLSEEDTQRFVEMDGVHGCDRCCVPPNE